MFILSFPVLVFNQSITWDRTYNNGESDMAMSIKPTIDNGYIVASNTRTQDTTDIWILKLNEFGDTVWTKTYGGPNCDGAYSIIQTNEGDYVISGYKSPSCYYWDFYIYVLKFNETGNFIWDYKYPGGNRMGYDLIETFDGGYLILGINYTFICNEILLIKLNQSGQFVWDKEYIFQSSPNLMYEVLQTQDSGFILVGERSNMYGQDIWIMKTDQYGDSTWNQTIDYQGNDRGYSIMQLDDGDFIIAANGGGNEYGYNQLLTYKLNTSGETIWVKSHYGNANFTSSSIIATYDDGFLTSGRIMQQVGTRGIFVFKQNYFGDSIWTTTYQKGAYGGATEIHQTTDEGYVISGYVSYNGPGTDKDVWVLKLNDSGLVDVQDISLNMSRNSVNLYPNPANQFVHCGLETPDITDKTVIIKIYSLGGKLFKCVSLPLDSPEHSIIPLDISSLESGIYIIKFELGKEIMAKKLIISKK